MPGTARPYLPKEQQSMSDAQIREMLANNPMMLEDVAMRHLKDLQEIWPNNPKAVAAAYFSGVGNVNFDGSVKDTSKNDGNMDVGQYVAAFDKRYGQNLATTPQTPTTSQTPTT